MPMPHDVLVVDEDAAALTTILTALNGAGYGAIGEPSFRDGLRTLAAHTPSVLICSVKLGVFNGLHLMVRGRADHPDLPAIVIGPASDVVAREARTLGASEYLPQPIDVVALLATVAGLFELAAVPV
jgi:DNA-binding NtrC family response regulator